MVRFSFRNFSWLLLGTAFGAGCTLVNPFDDVRTASEGQYAALPPTTTTGLSDGGAALGDASKDGSVPPRAPLAGAIVMSAESARRGDNQMDYFLTVLDPATGNEVNRGARENMVVAGVRYDGLRDLWYIFESGPGHFAPTPDDTVYLHVRQLDMVSGTWTELSKTLIPSLNHYDSIVALRDRLVFVAFAPAGSAYPLNLVTLDTSNPSNIGFLGDPVPIPWSSPPLGLLGSSSTTGPGGTINLAQINKQLCVNRMCDVEFLKFFVPNSGSPRLSDAPTRVGSTLSYAVPALAKLSISEQHSVVFPPPVTSGGNATVQLFQPGSAEVVGPTISFAIRDLALKRAATADCEDTLFVVGTNNDTRLYAVPLFEGGKAASIETTHSGQAVYYEPSSRTVFSPFNQGAGTSYSAYRLGGSKAEPTLSVRTDWMAPGDLRPLLLEIRQPLPVRCSP